MLAWLGKSIAAWNPSKDVNLRVFTAQVIVPALCNEGAWGIRWETNGRVEQHLIQKEAWKEIWYFLSSFTKCFGWIFLVILYLRLSGWNKEPSRWLGQVVKPFVCLVGPCNRLQCDPGPKHSPTRIGSRAKPNHANDSVFTSWRVPVSIQWVMRTCSALFGHFVCICLLLQLSWVLSWVFEVETTSNFPEQQPKEAFCSSDHWKTILQTYPPKIATIDWRLPSSSRLLIYHSRTVWVF